MLSRRSCSCSSPTLCFHFIYLCCFSVVADATGTLIVSESFCLAIACLVLVLKLFPTIVTKRASLSKLRRYHCLRRPFNLCQSHALRFKDLALSCDSLIVEICRNLLILSENLKRRVFAPKSNKFLFQVFASKFKFLLHYFICLMIKILFHFSFA